MLVLQHSTIIWKFMAGKIIKAIGSFVINLPGADHIKPGYPFITQLMPALTPDCLTKCCLIKCARGGGNKPCPYPYFIQCIPCCLVRPRTRFVLRFRISKQHPGIADIHPVEPAGGRTFYAKSAIGNNIKMFENIGCG